MLQCQLCDAICIDIIQTSFLPPSASCVMTSRQRLRADGLRKNNLHDYPGSKNRLTYYTVIIPEGMLSSFVQHCPFVSLPSHLYAKEHQRKTLRSFICTPINDSPSVQMAKSASITGCSKGGIGAALAQEFHRNGVRIFATARNLAKVEHFLKEKSIRQIY